MHIVPVTSSGLAASEHNFCHYLVADPQMNETEAYLKVNPNVKRKSACDCARRFLAKEEVRAYVAHLLEERSKRMEMDEDWVIGRLRDICDRCMQAVPVYGRELSTEEEEDNDRVPEPIYYKFDANGATKALELIGKHMKMFSDKTDSGGTSVMVNINLGYDVNGNAKPIIEGEFKRVGTVG
jgi:phage terminase small subunit